MTFTVTRRGNGFRISVGDGRPVYAETVEEIAQALRHYHAQPWHEKPVEDCPFCRMDSDRTLA